MVGRIIRFNTASGKYCCNNGEFFIQDQNNMSVSIPQAVSTVATANTSTVSVKDRYGMFQYRKR